METNKEIQVQPILPKNLGHWLEKKTLHGKANTNLKISPLGLCIYGIAHFYYY